jgi:hypothetical protein
VVVGLKLELKVVVPAKLLDCLEDRAVAAVLVSRNAYARRCRGPDEPVEAASDEILEDALSVPGGRRIVVRTRRGLEDFL